MNAYQANVFKLTLNTEYEMYPEKFNIKLTGLDRVAKMQRFDEIGGLKWNEKKEQGRRRRKVINTILTANERSIRANDHILFACRKAGYTKHQTNEIFEDVIEHYTQEYLSSIMPGVATASYYERMFVEYVKS